MDPQCGSKCSSKAHAGEINAAITLSKDREEIVLQYIQRACYNVGQNKDRVGRSALHVAASCGRMKIVEWLVSNKDAVINGKDWESGYSPLHRAVFFGQLHATRLLVSRNANLYQPDNDFYTPVDHLLKDRLAGNAPEASQPCEVYVWGSNANYTLGQSHQQNRALPEVLDVFRRDGTSLQQVAMGKFHSVFLTKSGQVYSCGHGQGGRLGHDDERAVVSPHLIKSLSAEVCVQVAQGMDHTVFLMENGVAWSCGMNQYHQLGHSPAPAQSTSPKPIGVTFKGKPVNITGICAGRFHTVFWNSAAVYTCGLNAGQLGHLKGEPFISAPKQVTSFTMKDMVITHVAASDGATAVATKKGDVYVLHEYQCRKIASKQLELEKVVMIGGNLDQKLNSDLLTEKGGQELQVVLLTKSGKLFVWRETNPQLTRCLFHFGRQLIIKDVALNRYSMILVTQEGEGFSGVLVSKRAKKLTSQSEQHKDYSVKLPANTLFEFVEREACDHIKLKRIPAIFRGVAVACDPKGENFAVIQMHPAANLVDVPTNLPSTFTEDLLSLLNEADVADYVHDIQFKAGYQIFAAHRYVLASRCEHFYKSICEANIDFNSEDVPVVEIEDVPAEVFRQILMFIYTGTCDLLKPGPCRLFTKQSGRASEKPLNLDESNEVKDNKKSKKRGKKPKKADVEDTISEDMLALRAIIDSAKKLGVYPLAKLLEKVSVSDGIISVRDRPTLPKLKFRRNAHAELHDAQIRSEDGKVYSAHRCMLAARLDYFRSMFGCGWIETTSSDKITLPILGSILEVLLDFFYEDEARKVESSDDIEFIGNVLVVADQFLISRLVTLCETALVSLVTVKNVGELLEFAATYNAAQLKQSCMQFICLNLPAVVEQRSWDCVSDDVMEDLTRYYRLFNPAVGYRHITPSSEAPSMELIELYCESEPLQVTSYSPNGEDAKKPKAKRKSGRRISESQTASGGKERHLSTSSVTSLESLELDTTPPIRALEKKEPRSGWSVVKKTPKKSSKDPGKEQEPAPQPKAQPVATPPKPIPSPQRPTPPRGAFPAEKPALAQSPELFPSLLEAAQIQSPPASQNSSSSHKFTRMSQKQRKTIAKSETQTTTSPVAAVTWERKPTSAASFADILREEELRTKSRQGAIPKTPVTVASPTSPKTSLPWKKDCDEGKVRDGEPTSRNRLRFEDILAEELQQKMNLVKAHSKPLGLTQMEDQAMEELRAFYHADEVVDEHIVVERVVVGALATPVWRSGSGNF